MEETERKRLEQKIELEVKRLEGAIKSGDDQLLLHISGQKEAVLAALQALDQRLALAARAAEQAARAVQTAQDKFEDQVKQNDEKSNEFRQSLSDLSSLMATRRELEALGDRLTEQAEGLGNQIIELRSRLDVGPAGLASVQKFADIAEASKLTTSKLITYLVAAVAILSMVIAGANYLTNRHNSAPATPQTVTVTVPTPRGP